MLKAIGLALCGVLALASVQATAQELTYPKKNITVIIPKNPGGGTDTSARLTLEYAKKYLPEGVIFVPENKPAGNGVTGLIEAARAKPDGQTLVMTTVELAMFPHQNKSPVNYENFTGLYAPIADPASLVVNADSPYKTLEDFVEAAKENPGKIQVANSGTGAIYDLATINMEQQLGIDLKRIPYSEGIGPAIAALVGGHVDAVVTTPGAAKPQIDAGALRMLGVMDSKRFALFPDVPTFNEALGAGTDTQLRAWAAIAGPANMPEDVKGQLIEVFKAVAADPEFQQAMKNQGIMPSTLVGDKVQEMMKRDDEMYAKLIEDSKNSQ
ncbi:Bug family tripartite tricarboxylate transporter substrate binding protein [Martelella mediterranea]|uniref:Tripartite-type tricarboxylate transporter receptor subunit TctC n=1 Tax=Martelella mediterranea TaxID=293089 RepID=A0A4R3NM96_9HYPH|nr:tripartite tricarboxylate transporter substrate binding protein [Martelella mediterranea]TCT36323.1 tripartite-type tricarboxylate transporter receptor subunit TctC [Martelella mediterranea]